MKSTPSTESVYQRYGTVRNQMALVYDMNLELESKLEIFVGYTAHFLAGNTMI